jgi:hypothetical protein
MTTPAWIITKITEIRSADSKKRKYEIQEELKRQGGMVGQSTIQKVIKLKSNPPKPQIPEEVSGSQKENHCPPQSSLRNERTSTRVFGAGGYQVFLCVRNKVFLVYGH